MMTSSVVKKANIAGDDVCSLENLANANLEFSPKGDSRSGPLGPLLPVKNLTFWYT